MLTDERRGELRQAIKASVAREDAAAAVRDARALAEGSPRAADTMFCSTALSSIGDALHEQLGARRLRTFIVRSVTVEPLLPHLATEAIFAGYLLDVRLGGFGSYVDDLLNTGGDLPAFQPDLVMVLLDLDDVAGRLPELCADGVGAEVTAEIARAVSHLEQLLRGFRSGSSARLLVQGFVVPDTGSLGEVAEANLPQGLPNAVAALNRELAAACRAIPDCVFFDVDRLAGRHGRSGWSDARLFLASRLQVAAGNFRAYARGLVRSASVLFRAPRKVLCTDLDNTLWGGILGEDGPEGIATGSTYPGNAFLQYQRYLKQLSSRGILLAAVSKNNLSDVQEAFASRAADLALTLDDFAAVKINWQEKSDSLRQLAEELSLGLDAFVFVDDNPVECEAIRQRLPEVAVVAAPVDELWKLTEMLAREPFFDAIHITEDDRNRLGEYKAQVQRAQLEQSAGGRDEFLASLGIVATFVSALDAPLARSVQLLAKTNQFNLTTRRHSAAEIEAFAASPSGQAVAVRVRDRFGDAGVVGLALARQDGPRCVIDSFLLSCRVIGRGVETALLAAIAEEAIRHGATALVGEFIPSKKNAPCAGFYPDHGFTPAASPSGAESASTFYQLDLTTQPPASPPWIALEGKDSHELAGRTLVTS